MAILTADPTPQTHSNANQFFRMDAGDKDVAMLQDLLKDGVHVGNENNETDLYLNGLIEKPWGQEYRPYVDDFIDIWHLQILPGQSTSTHAHPRKTTYLICLAGQGVSVSLDREIPLKAGTILRIGRGAFHATHCSPGTEPLMLLEVETPRNKFDLVRMADKYRRAGTQYEPEGKILTDKRKRLPQLPNASLVSKSPCKMFKFSVRTGMEIFYRRSSMGLLAICLSPRGILSENVSIITPGGMARDHIETDAHYLCVEHIQN